MKKSEKKTLHKHSPTCWVARKKNRIVLEGLDGGGVAIKINICAHHIITDYGESYKNYTW